MANIPGRSSLSPAIAVVVIVVVVAIIGFLGWKTVGKGGESDKVPVDANKVKEALQSGGFGHKK